MINAKWDLSSGRTVELRVTGDAYSRLHPFKRFQRKRNNRMGTRFAATVASSETGLIVYSGELMLAAWSENSTAGQAVKFWIDDEATAHPFAGYRRRDGNNPGSMFALALVEIQEDQTPVNQVAEHNITNARKAGPKPSQQAHLMVTSPMFLQYLVEMKPNVAHWTAETARGYVKATLGIESLSDLDRNNDAWTRFQTMIRQPYAKWGGNE